MILLLAAALTQAQPVAEPETTVSIAAGPCHPTIDGVPVAMPALRDQARQWAQERRKVALVVADKANDNCVAKLFALLVDANVKRLRLTAADEAAPK